MTTPETPCVCGTCGGILKMLKAATATPWTPEERAAMLARAARDIERITPILAQRERDRLLKMPCSGKIQ